MSVPRPELDDGIPDQTVQHALGRAIHGPVERLHAAVRWIGARPVPTPSAVAKMAWLLSGTLVLATVLGGATPRLDDACSARNRVRREVVDSVATARFRHPDWPTEEIKVAALEQSRSVLARGLNLSSSAERDAQALADWAIAMEPKYGKPNTAPDSYITNRSGHKTLDQRQPQMLSQPFGYREPPPLPRDALDFAVVAMGSCFWLCCVCACGLIVALATMVVLRAVSRW